VKNSFVLFSAGMLASCSLDGRDGSIAVANDTNETVKLSSLHIKNRSELVGLTLEPNRSVTLRNVPEIEGDVKLRYARASGGHDLFIGYNSPGMGINCVVVLGPEADTVYC